MLATIRDRLAPGTIDPLHLYRAAALVVVGLRPANRDLDHGQLARAAVEVADAMMEAPSDEPLA